MSELLIEPGRSLVAPVGVTLYRVLTLKQAGKLHVATDGGMGDNLEYPLYGQRFEPLVVGTGTSREVLADLVGRHCESGDIVTPDVELRNPQVGDLVRRPGHRRLLLHHAEQLQRRAPAAGDLLL